MTVTWHVDDLKVSHADPAEITKFANYLAVIYGEKLTVQRGLVHDYLGMDLDYTTKGKVGISVIKYVDKILEGFSEELGASAATPAAEHLFQVRNTHFRYGTTAKLKSCLKTRPKNSIILLHNYYFYLLVRGVIFK